MDVRDELQHTLGSAYTIERELGGGGMSRVFVAEELRLKRQVVIKLLSPELAQGISIERFDREIQTAASLQQANIVPVLTAGESNGLPYYIMPLVKGESLRARLARGPMPIGDAIGVLRDTARALAYAHEQGVVHRDIKPDNILLSGETAVVTDFGIAKAISASRTQAAGDTLTQVGTSLGTPAYMAPEQIAGDPNVDQRSDLYALGCVAYELLTGHPPFDNRTPQRMLAAHLTEPPRPVQELRLDCPPALAELVMQLLAKDPNARPASAVLVAQALNAVTTSGASPAMAAALIGTPPSFLKAMLGYLATFIIAVIVSRAAVIAIGLPEWIVPSIIVLMIVALPLMLGTMYVQHVTRRQAMTTPALTPGGSTITHSTMATLAIKMAPHVSWKRSQRVAGYAAGVFVALVAAFMGLRALGIGPAGSLFAAGRLHEQDKLLVADFTVAREDSALAPILSEAVRSALGQSRVVQLLSPADVAAALTQMRRSRDDRVTDAIAPEVAARAGAQAVVSGRVARVGTGYAVSIALTSASGGSPLASYQATADGAKDLLTAVDELAKKLRAKMGESLRQVEHARPLAEATTSSLEALRKYSEGVQANDVDIDYDRAIAALRQAVALDTTFALAYRKLAVALGNGGYGTPERDSALERAARYADKLPDREKGLVMGAYYSDQSRQGDLPKAIAAYEAAYAADSMSMVAASQLSTLYCGRSDFTRCRYYARRMFIAQPTVVGASRYAQVLATVGDYAAAHKLLDSLERANPASATLTTVWVTRAELYYADGKLDSLRALVNANLNSDNGNSRDNAQGIVGGLAILRGRPHEAERTFFAIEKSLAAKGNNTPPVKDSLLVALMETLFEGNASAGLRALDGALAAHPIASMPMITRPYLDVAGAYALGGQVEKARAMMARYDAEADAALRRQSVAPWHQTRGEIALAEGHYPEAVAEFRQRNTLADGSPGSCGACVDFDLARAFDKAGQADSAIAAFERYLAVPTIQRFLNPDVTELAITEKRLGELYDAKGDLTRATSHYTSFVQLWQAAEPELQPAVAGVKQRLAAIAAHEHR